MRAPVGQVFVQSRHSTHEAWFVALTVTSMPAAAFGLGDDRFQQHAAARLHGALAAAVFGELVDHVAFGQVQHILHALALFFAVHVFECVRILQAALARDDVDRVVFRAVERLAAAELVARDRGGVFFQLGDFAVEAHGAAAPRFSHFDRAGEQQLAAAGRARAVFAVFQVAGDAQGRVLSQQQRPQLGRHACQARQHRDVFGGRESGKTFSLQVDTLFAAHGHASQMLVQRRVVVVDDVNASQTPMHTPHCVQACSSMTGSPVSPSNEMAEAGQAMRQRSQEAPCGRAQCVSTVIIFMGRFLSDACRVAGVGLRGSEGACGIRKRPAADRAAAGRAMVRL